MNQVPISKLGSGIEMIFTLLLLRSVSGQAKGSVVYLIDEPEISLHPQAQQRLLEILVAESKTKQIFISTHSSHITDPQFLDHIIRLRKGRDKEIATHRATDALTIEEERRFFRRHRDLFFTDSAIFLEGIEDVERYTKFCQRHGLDDLPRQFVMMNGCDGTFFFEHFCKDFGIRFAALVDSDFSIKRSFWSRSNNQRAATRLRKFMEENSITYDAAALDEAFVREAQTTPRKDEREAVSVAFNGANILRVKGKNIGVLARGEVEDYLGEDGCPVAPDAKEKEKELVALFGWLRECVA